MLDNILDNLVCLLPVLVVLFGIPAAAVISACMRSSQISQADERLERDNARRRWIRERIGD